MNRRSRKPILLLAVSGLTLGATCGPLRDGDSTADSVSELDGAWRLVTMGDAANPTPIPADVAVTLDFDADSFSGSGGCNRYTGSYEVVGAGTWEPGPVAATRMACPGAAGEVEARYLETFGATRRFEIEDRRLQLSTHDGRVLIYVPAP